MGVSTQALAAAYPRLYHLTSEGSWPSIEHHGLLSTVALLDLFEIDGEERDGIISQRRPDCVPIAHPVHGRAIVRDQKPLSESRLRAVLQGGMTPRDWYTLLNNKVFFWVSEKRFETLRDARAYVGWRQTLIVVDSGKLLAHHGDRVTLCPMNSGATRPMAFPRGRDTFLPLGQYPFEERRKRVRDNAVVELAVEYAVPDLRDFVLSVTEIGGGQPEHALVF